MRLLECTREKSFCPLKQSQSLGNPFDGEVRIVIRGKTTRCITAHGFSTFSTFNRTLIEGLPCQRVVIIQPSHCVGHMLHCGQIALGILEDFSFFCVGCRPKGNTNLWRSHSVPLTQRISPEARGFKPFVNRDGFSAWNRLSGIRVPIVISDNLSRSRQLILAKWFYKTRRLWNILVVP
jgi:hypothetical protein